MNRILALQKLEARGSARLDLEFCETTGGGSTISAGCTPPIRTTPSTSPETATD